MPLIQILIVEDDPIIAADLEDRLTEMGFGVMGAVASGEEAMPYISGDPAPDLVLLDIQLEGEWDGIQTAHSIREQSDLAIVFLTSNADENTFTAAKKARPQAFLGKPFRGRDLKHAIELAIDNLGESTMSTKTSPRESTTELLNDRLFIKVKDRMQRILCKDILWIQADDYYCKVITRDKELLVTKTLKKFSQELADHPEFVRVHRSYIVNIRKIEEIGEIHLFIQQQQIPIGGSYRESLLESLKRI